MRSRETSSDYATTAEALLEVLQRYAQQGRTFDTLCCLYPTAPFVTGEKLRQASLLLDKDHDFVMPVVQYSFPPQRAMRIQDGSLRYLHPENQRTRSQDLEPIYHDCGQFYFCKVAAFQKAQSLVGDRTAPFLVRELETQDIDTLSDWHLAELKYQYMEESNVSSAKQDG